MQGLQPVTIDLLEPGDWIEAMQEGYLANVARLVASLYIGWRLAQSKFGRVLTALRDAENRLMFCGYDPRGFKLFVWVLSAVLCGLAGALYVPQVGIINPSEMSPTNSIEAAVWVALGGRGTLIGPLLGAGVVNGIDRKSTRLNSSHVF